MRRNSLIFGLVLLALGAAAHGSGDLPTPFDRTLSPNERLEALAAQMRRAHETLDTLEAEFSQVKQSALLLEADRSEGEFFYAAPDRVRWEYLAPQPISLVIANRLMTTWYRDIAEAERAEIGEQSDRVFRYLGAGTSLDELLKYFQVSLHLPPGPKEPLRLELTPRFERVARRVQGFDIWLDPELFLPVRLRFVEGDGDVTEYEFRNMRRNQGIADETFQLDLPVGVRVKEVRLGNGADGADLR